MWILIEKKYFWKEEDLSVYKLCAAIGYKAI